MRVAITGSNGLIGAALVGSLLADGHQVLRLTRGQTRGGAGDGTESASWDPAAGTVQPGAFEGADAVVHLAGAGVGDKRWSEAYKREIRDSRVIGTAAIARAVAETRDRPRVLISGSAVGYYGETGDRVVVESDPAGDDFLARVSVDWEAAASRRSRRASASRTRAPAWSSRPRAARGAGSSRSSASGSAARWARATRYWPFISLADHIAALRFVIEHDDVAGPLNFTGPEPLTNREVTRAMGRALHRPTLAAVPSPVLRLVVGEFATSITASCRAVPAGLQKAGFTFQYPNIEQALDAVLHPAR